MEYPTDHRQIVKELLSGRFIDSDSPFFSTLCNKKAFYSEFFEETYGYYLEDPPEFFYLSSTETSEHSSRDFLLFLALLCYEYHNRGKDIVHKISNGTFLLKEVIDYIKKSSKRQLLQKTQAVDPTTGELEVKRFLENWERRNLLKFTTTDHTQFIFKKAINLFLHTAFALYENNLQKKDNPPKETTNTILPT